MRVRFLNRRARILILMGVALLAVAISMVRMARCCLWRPDVPQRSEILLDDFRGDGNLSSKSYRKLFLYFVEGLVSQISVQGAYAAYPGLPMLEGSAATRRQGRLEGFTRSMPLIAAWLSGGRPSRIRLLSGRRVDLLEIVKQGLLSGTDRHSREYWGDIGDYDPRIVEAADVALSIWLLRERLWAALDSVQRESVVRWLEQVNGKRIVDNNWHLFIVLVDAALGSLGARYNREELQSHYARVKSFHAGDGWFRDGPQGRFDYYNAWEFQYALSWLERMRPAWDPEFLREVRRDFAAKYKYFFGPNGFPILGRSVCYRMAAPAPLIFASASDSDVVSVGEARRALDLTWRYFIRHGAVRAGNVTQGYCGPDPRVLDSYSGPASCLWSLRSLVAAFYLRDDSGFWTSRGDPLPVEQGDFSIELRSIGWRIVGDTRAADVRLVSLTDHAALDAELEPYTLRDRVLNALLCRGNRPENTAAKYLRSSYSSISPFTGCSP